MFKDFSTKQREIQTNSNTLTFCLKTISKNGEWERLTTSTKSIQDFTDPMMDGPDA